MTALPRTRSDRCPGVLRPWLADDGALLRVRVVGGRLTQAQLRGLSDLAQRYGDGDVHVTTRANVQLRGVATPVPAAVVAGIEELGLLPSRAHERVRNVLVSPLTGLLGGSADLRPVARELDAAVLAEPRLAELPGRFLFALDDRGDLHDRPADLAAVAVAADRARLCAGGLPGDVVALTDVPTRLVDLALAFLDRRGTGPAAAWHVAELAGGGAALGRFGPGTAAPHAPRPPLGPLDLEDGSRALHVPVHDGRLRPVDVAGLLSTGCTEVVLTPWRSAVAVEVAS